MDAFRDMAFSKENAAEVLGISPSGAYKLLARMTEKGLLIAGKDGKQWKYTVIKD